MLLKYDISVTGEAAVAQALRGVQRRVQAMMRQAQAEQVRAGMGTGRGGPYRTSGRPRINDVTAFRGAQEIGKLAVRLEMQRHRAAMANRRREEAAMVAAEKRAARAAQRASQDRLVAARGRLGAVGGAGASSLAAVGRRGAGLLAIGGGALVGAAVRRESNLSKFAANIANQAYGNTKGSRQELFNRAMGTAKAVGARGIGAESAGEGLAAFQAVTGEFDIGMGIAKDAADVALATGADFKDVMGVAAESMLLMQNKGIKGADALKQVEEILSILAAQGKLGSIEFSDLATQMAKLGASTSDFAGTVPEIVATMGAMAQIGKRGGAHNVEEATTALMNLRREMTNPTTVRKLKAQGVDPFTYTQIEGKKVRTGIKNPLEVLEDLARNTKGDILDTAVMGARAAKVGQPFFAMMQAMGGGDVEKGISMARAEFEKFEKAKQSKGERQQSAAFRRQQADIQFSMALEDLQNKVGPQLLQSMSRLIPKFVEMTPTIEKAADMFTKFVDALARAPMDTIGKVIAAKVALDIASAGLGNIMRTAAEKAVGTAGGGAPGAGGRGAFSTSTAGAMNATFTGITVGTIVATAITATSLSVFESAEAQGKAGAKQLQFLQATGNVEEGKRFAAAQRTKASEMEDASTFNRWLMSASLPSLLLNELAFRPAAQFESNADVMRQQAAQAEKIDPKGIPDLLSQFSALGNAAASATQALSAVQPPTGGPGGGPNRGNSPTMPR